MDGASCRKYVAASRRVWCLIQLGARREDEAPASCARQCVTTTRCLAPAQLLTSRRMDYSGTRCPRDDCHHISEALKATLEWRQTSTQPQLNNAEGTEHQAAQGTPSAHYFEKPSKGFVRAMHGGSASIYYSNSRPRGEHKTPLLTEGRQRGQATPL